MSGVITSKSAPHLGQIKRRPQGPPIYLQTNVRAQLVAGLREFAADDVKARLLLIAQWPIKVVERKLHRISCIDHGLQALLHSLQPAGRSDWRVLGAGGLHDRDSLGG